MKHVAIIMDGNGRWAIRKGLTRIDGHKKGADNLKQLINYVSTQKRDIGYLSVYAFSIQNWGRPKDEIVGLFNIAKSYYSDVDFLIKNNIRLRTQGYIDIYPNEIKTLIDDAILKTRHNTGLVLTIVLSYGGREEIVETVNKVLEETKKTGNFSINMNDFLRVINPDKIPDPDLIIRTSGEYRVSNFLLWQSAYSEYLFVDTLWPDFNEVQFELAMQEYFKRSRRFGLVTVSTANNVIVVDKKLPDENHCRSHIQSIINKRHTHLHHTEKYTKNILLQRKYFNIIEGILNLNIKSDRLLAENLSYNMFDIVRKLIPNKPEDFYEHLHSCIKMTFVVDRVIENSIYKKDRSIIGDENVEEMTIIDLYRIFMNYMPSTENEEKIKETLLKLDKYDIELYKRIAINDQKNDYASRILMFFYGMFPILTELNISNDMMCNMSILLPIADDFKCENNTISANNTIGAIYHIIESVIEVFEEEETRREINETVSKNEINYDTLKENMTELLSKEDTISEEYKIIYQREIDNINEVSVAESITRDTISGDNIIQIKLKVALIYLFIYINKQEHKNIRKRFSVEFLYRYISIILNQ